MYLRVCWRSVQGCANVAAELHLGRKVAHLCGVLRCITGAPNRIMGIFGPRPGLTRLTGGRSFSIFAFAFAFTALAFIAFVVCSRVCRILPAVFSSMIRHHAKGSVVPLAALVPSPARAIVLTCSAPAAGIKVKAKVLRFHSAFSCVVPSFPLAVLVGPPVGTAPGSLSPVL